MMADEAGIAHAEEIAVVVATVGAEVIAAVAETAGAEEAARERTATERTSSSTMWLSRVVIVMSGRLTLIAHLMILLPILLELVKHVQAKAIVISWRIIRITARTNQL